MAKDYVVLVVGDIHEGKSQLVDCWRDRTTGEEGPEILEEGKDANTDGTTKGCRSYTGNIIEGRRTKIFDTPGISDGTAFLASADTDDEDEEPDDEQRLAAGTGGLLKLLEKTFKTHQINLVVIVHPCNKTSVQMGARVLRGLIEKKLVAGDSEAHHNILVAFTKADQLGDNGQQKMVNRRKKNMLEAVLPRYFDGFPNSGASSSSQAASQGTFGPHCFTYGIPVSGQPRSAIVSHSKQMQMLCAVLDRSGLTRISRTMTRKKTGQQSKR